MKKFKKIMAVLVAAIMIMATMVPAWAGINITVNRDNSTYTEGGTSETGNRTYTYYQIFRATEASNHSSTGGGYDSDGTPGVVSSTPDDGITYYLDASTDATRITQLGAAGNVWFQLDRSADGTRYTVSWKNAYSDTDTVQEAARWLGNDSNYTPITSANLTANQDGTQWTASDLPEGYYLIKGETGSNLIAATADIVVNEKNSYPTVDKKQGVASGTYGDDQIGVKIGDTIYYQVEVKVPANSNADIIVADTMSPGLTFDITKTPAVKVGGNPLTVDVAENDKKDYFVDTKAAQSWTITIHPTVSTKGKTVVITFDATVNGNTLTDASRSNTVEITYGNYHQTDMVSYDIAAAAIIKYDGNTAAPDGNNALQKSGEADIKYVEASFRLTDASNNEIKVSEASSGVKGVYVVDPNGSSSTVTSDKTKNGIILIYGLDPDETYKLTETSTENGYNYLTTVIQPTTVKAEKETLNTTKVTVSEVDGIYAGDSAAASANTLVLSAAQVLKVPNVTGNTLPSTGGMGTTVLYIVGGMLIVLAGAYLFFSRKKTA